MFSNLVVTDVEKLYNIVGSLFHFLILGRQKKKAGQIRCKLLNLREKSNWNLEVQLVKKDSLSCIVVACNYVVDFRNRNACKFNVNEIRYDLLYHQFKIKKHFVQKNLDHLNAWNSLQTLQLLIYIYDILTFYCVTKLYW